MSLKPSINEVSGTTINVSCSPSHRIQSSSASDHHHSHEKLAETKSHHDSAHLCKFLKNLNCKIWNHIRSQNFILSALESKNDYSCFVNIGLAVDLMSSFALHTSQIVFKIVYFSKKPSFTAQTVFAHVCRKQQVLADCIQPKKYWQCDRRYPKKQIYNNEQMTTCQSMVLVTIWI